MFSNCITAEIVVLLSHKNTNTHIEVTMEFGEGKVPVGKIAEKAEEYIVE